MSGFSLDTGDMAELAKRLDDITASAQCQPIPEHGSRGAFGNDILDAAYSRFLDSAAERAQLTAQWSENIASFVRHSARSSEAIEDDVTESFRKTAARLSGDM